MTTGRPLILFTRTGCHLCERVAAMLEDAGLRWRPVDIDGSAELEGSYGLRVPVLRHPDTGRELDFPFGRAELLRFVGQ